MTLEEKVREILWQETQGGQTLVWDRLVSHPDREVPDLEYTSRFWGFAYGLAYGIGRGEDPYESDEDVATRAHDVALELFKDDRLHQLEMIRALEAGRAPAEAVTV